MLANILHLWEVGDIVGNVNTSQIPLVEVHTRDGSCEG